MKEFDHIIGQNIAKTRLIESIQSGAKDKEMLSPLLIGEAGKGKSALKNAYLNGMREIGADVLSFETPAELRSKGAHFSSFIQCIIESPKYCIAFDEAHEINGAAGQAATVQLAQVRQFLMKALDKTNQNKAIRLNDEMVVDFNRARGSILLATNFPHVLDKSGAFQSRCDTIILDDYTDDELVAILQGMLKNAGFQAACDKTLSVIAKCGRGTARPLEKLVDQMKITSNAGDGKKTINRDDVRNALRMTKMYPLGLQAWEVNILKRTQLPIRDNVLQSVLPNIEKVTFNKSKGYLLGKGLASQTTQGIQRTDKGERYLKEIVSQGFAV